MRASPSPQSLDESATGFRFAPEWAWDGEPRVAGGAVRRVLVMGDIHGSADDLRTALRVAAAEGCDVLVSVGDFGLQDASSPRRDPCRVAPQPSPIPELIREAMRAPIPIVVVDGNHEVWPCLRRFRHRADVAEERPAGWPLHLGGSLWWADRGSTWTWAGRRCGALGGAVSVDKNMPSVAGLRWPADEAPSDGDVARLCDNAPGGLDVLFCHDAPSGVRGLPGHSSAFPIEIIAEADDVRRLLRAAVDRTEPRLVFHGHWHIENRDRIADRPSDVFGLANDGRPGYLAALSLEDLDAAYLPDGSSGMRSAVANPSR